MPSCQVKGVEISYLEVGQKSSSLKNLIFIHGAGGNSGRWINQIEQLGKQHPERYYAIAPDLPGHGQSGGEACGQIFLYREWIKEIAEAVGMGRIVVVGHSMGGAVALDFALKYPQFAAGLIIIGSGTHFEIGQTQLEAYRRGEYTMEQVRASFASSSPTHLVQKIFQDARQSDPWARYLDFLACDRFQVEDLQNIVVKTLIICGAEDINTPPILSEQLADKINGAELRIIDNAAHQVMLEQPEIVNKHIIHFLEEKQ